MVVDLAADEHRMREFREKFDVFGRDLLKIRDKTGAIVPFVMNKVQLIAHDMIEQQRAEKGWVRALVLKGRQPGISTYVAARYYHKASLRKGRNVYILSHEQTASDNLFAIVDRFQKNNELAPHVGASNAKELVFDLRDSSYQVATAGTKSGGRGRSISLFHGSEVAFWQNAGDHFSASVQGVPLIAGTEVILESTSAGMGGEFYDRFLAAEAGRGDYIPIFLPWFLSDAPEYQRDPGPSFELVQERPEEGVMSEQEYSDVYKVSLAQMAWRRSRIEELRDPFLFRREYPATSNDAWTPPIGHEPFISSLLVQFARNRKGTYDGPLVLGVDPASNGGDRFSVAARRGMWVPWVRYRDKINSLEGTAWIKSLIDEHKPARVNIDAGHIGAAIITNLKSLGPEYSRIVRAVDFGATAEAKLARPKTPGPGNRRAEMWKRMKDWLEMPEGAILPDDSALEADICAPKLKPRLNNDFVLESKADMKKRQVRSPDLADSLALTFAYREHLAHVATPQVATYGDLDTPRGSAVDMDYGNIDSWMS